MNFRNENDTKSVDKIPRLSYHKVATYRGRYGGENVKTYGEKLRDLRGAKSRSEVAKACGISVSALTMYELNARRPRDEIKERLAAYYKKSLSWIFFAS